jgi:hypothetical protein
VDPDFRRSSEAAFNPDCRFDSLYTTSQPPENLNCATGCGFRVPTTAGDPTTEKTNKFNSPFVAVVVEAGKVERRVQTKQGMGKRSYPVLENRVPKE